MNGTYRVVRRIHGTGRETVMARDIETMIATINHQEVKDGEIAQTLIDIHHCPGVRLQAIERRANRLLYPEVPNLGTGMKGKPVDEIIQKFWGDISKWPAQQEGGNFGQDQIRRIAEHIVETGDCLWHAQHIVMGWTAPCHCARCTDARDVAARAQAQEELKQPYGEIY